MGALQDRGHQAHNLKAAGSNPARERTLPRPSSLTAMFTGRRKANGRSRRMNETARAVAAAMDGRRF